MAVPAAIIFDLGRVLVRLDFSAATARFPRLRIDEIIKFSHLDDEQFMAFDRGEISPENFHVYLMQKFNLSLTFSEFKSAWTSVFLPMPGIWDLLSELRACRKFDFTSKYKFGLLSDTDTLHWNFVRENFSAIPAIFPQPTLSFRTGVLKPHRDAFLFAAADVSCSPEQCLFIDDRLDNVEGARAAGMSAVQFSDVPTLRKELAQMEVL